MKKAREERAIPVKIVEGRFFHLGTGEQVADPRDKAFGLVAGSSPAHGAV
jgi:hypothetical protein